LAPFLVPFVFEKVGACNEALNEVKIGSGSPSFGKLGRNDELQLLMLLFCPPRSCEPEALEV
jgi:hypothetical protein